MNLAAWISPLGWDLELCGRLCLVLAHSLWQFALLAFLATWMARLMKNASPEKVYALYAGALLLGLLALPVTFALTRLPGEPSALSDMASMGQQEFSRQPNSAPQKMQQAPPPHMAGNLPELPAGAQVIPAPPVGLLLTWAPWLVVCYSLGVMIMLMRLVRGLWLNNRLSAQATSMTSGPLVETLQALTRTWSLGVAPAIALTERVIVPQVVGLWRPVILLPAAALAGLRPEELEMILAHELAHVRRYDLWANLVQRLAEAVLFFNPAAWYLSRQISIYREYCCDDTSCRITRQSASDTRVRYATALLHAVELTQGPQQCQKLAALAASGSRPSELRRRVARLFGEPVREPVRITRTGLVTMLVGVAAILIVPLARQNAAETRVEAKQAASKKKPTVEVVAIGTHDEEPQRWWDAQGKLLEKVPFTWKAEPEKVTTDQKLWRRVVIRVDAAIANSPSSRSWQIIGARGSAGGVIEFTGGFEPGTYLSRYFSLADGTDTFAIRFGLALGEWQTIAKASGMGAQGSKGKSVVFSQPMTTDEGVDVVVSHNVVDQAYRVIAIDKQGDTHESVRGGGVSAGQISQSRATFPRLALEDLDRFEFQIRPYEWTDLTNLPVEPGKKLAAKVDHNASKELPKNVDEAKIAAIQEYVDECEEEYRRTEKLYEAGLAGSDARYQAKVELYVARGNLAVAKRDFVERDEHFRTALQAAEELVKVQQTRYDQGNITQNVLSAAKLQRAQIKAALAGDQQADDESLERETKTQEKTDRPIAPRKMPVRVVDTDGNPLEGAWLFRNLTFLESATQRTRVKNETYYTDNNGEAIIDVEGGTVNLNLWVKKDSFVPLVISWRDVASEAGDKLPEEFEFRMTPGTKIGGIVTNVAGIPIEGVKVEVEDASHYTTETEPVKSEKRPGRSNWLAYGDAGVVTDAHGHWSLDNVPTDEELVLSDEEAKDPYNTPLRLRFSHPDYETIDGIEYWQKVWNPPLETLRNGTNITVMKWVDRDDRGRVNAVRLDDGEQYKNADFSGRYFKGQQILVWHDDKFAGANLAGSTWEDMMIPGMENLLKEADLSGSKLIGVNVSGRSGGMQKTKFNLAELQGASLTGGVSGFQEANFDKATITNSELTGGASAFQKASFQGAKLHSSKLWGEGPAFQMAHFDNARLEKTTIASHSPAAFQGVTLNDTVFIECDLSSLDASALASCEFDASTPPGYDAKTRLPAGFDPQQHGWKLVER